MSIRESRRDEPCAAAVFEPVVASERRLANIDGSGVAHGSAATVAIGTPIGQHLNPDIGTAPPAIAAIAHQLRDGQLVVLRPAVCETAGLSI
jgi:UDP-N-acetyl-D-mannosaminuronic acid dehydrogenase